MSPQVVELKKRLKIKEGAENSPDIHALILAGVDKTLIDRVMLCLGLTKKEMLALLPISDTHLRRIKGRQKLSAQVTEHIYAIAEVVVAGYRLMSNPKDFREWLFDANVVLDNKRPYAFLSTIHGCGLLRTFFSRVAHGIPL